MRSEADSSNLLGRPMLLRRVWEESRHTSEEASPTVSATVLAIGTTPAQERFLRSRHHTVILANSSDLATEEIVPLLEGKAIEHVIWIAPDTHRRQDSLLSDDMLIDQQAGIFSLFRLVKALLLLGYNRNKLGWTIITRRTFCGQPPTRADPTHAGVHGFAGSLSHEQPRWKIRLIDIPDDEAVSLEKIFHLPAHTQGNSYLYRGGRWNVQRWLRCDIQTGATAAYRRHGVYVIVGGAGGIGEVLSNFLAQRYQAHVIWLGRRALDHDIQRKIDRCAGLGPAPTYIRADASDHDSLMQAYLSIKKDHAQIHGVIHSAIALLDGLVAGMSEDRLRECLAVKIGASVRLAQVFERERLDFALFFSSFVSFLRPPGQSNYAAGCAFQDAYAEALGRLSVWPVKVMNWGYWGTVGVVANEKIRAQMRLQGFDSIEPDEGMAALEVLLQGSSNQLMLLRACRSELMRRFAENDECEKFQPNQPQ